MPSPLLGEQGEKAVALAADILRLSRQEESRSERKRSGMMARMMADPAGKAFVIAMTDEVLRIASPKRAAARLHRLVEEHGVPTFFPGLDRAALRVGDGVARLLPGAVIPLVKSRLRSESAHVAISAETRALRRYLRRRQGSGVRVNVNQLGEAVLGEREASRRLNDNLSHLADANVDYVSIKLSALASQISLTGYRETVEEIKPRLRTLYRAAMAHAPHKFVNLDMEEYRDLHLTLDVFREVLDEPEFLDFEAGIVLQAYLPDSYPALQSLTQWALQRRVRGGARIKVRLVKGANLAMERVEAALEDWALAPYGSKAETDANYKRMLSYALSPEHTAAVRIGVGSHNLFDIALAMILRDERGVAEAVEFEMLEGMADGQAKVVQARSGGLLVYAPIVLDHEFDAAIAYLVRRLDENTAPGGFLPSLFALEEGSEEWARQRQMFLDACALAGAPSLHAGPRRQQDRRTTDADDTPLLMRLMAEGPTTVAERIPVAEPADPQPSASPSVPAHAKATTGSFENEANTDFSLPSNRAWADAVVAHAEAIPSGVIPLQIAGTFRNAVGPTTETAIGKDPSFPNDVRYHTVQASSAQVEEALQAAVAAQGAWAGRSRSQRAQLLRRVATELSARRGEAIAAMMVDAGKSMAEADVEVSEAVDFATYYADTFQDAMGFMDGARFAPLGTVVVTPPWNFPFAIPAGGILAALMAGNTVILKPAPETTLVAAMLAACFWRAGVPPEVLQFVPVADGPVGQALLSDRRVNAVVLTGAFETATLFRSFREDLRIFAETSGKNALYVSASADIDLAVKDLVRGAFGHAGQKCSASSLGLIHHEVYDDPRFLAQLQDAAESLVTGTPWQRHATMTPLIREPGKALMRGLTQLDEGESWLVQPCMEDGNPRLWRPGIRLGVQAGSWYHRTECFGPVLGLIRVKDVDEAIALQNGGRFGLTGGIHSLDPEETERWRAHVEVGNGYINRGTTGAIVRRQAFGGWRDSSVGPGHKAGGPNYVAMFGHFEDDGEPSLRGTPSDEVQARLEGIHTHRASDAIVQKLQAAAASDAYWWAREFAVEHDPSQIHGESNIFRYRPRPWHLVRLASRDGTSSLSDGACFALARTALACTTCHVPLLISAESASPELTEWAHVLGATLFTESWADMVARLRTQSGRLGASMRVVPGDGASWTPAAGALTALSETGVVYVEGTPVTNGRVELLRYLREQSISECTHRYGNLRSRVG